MNPNNNFHDNHINMQYTIELLELWWASLTATMKDETMAFPISLLIGAAAGVLCWFLAAKSAALWNKRYYLKVGLQILCAIAALLSIVYALTFVSTRNTAQAVKERLVTWKEQAIADQEWQGEIFKDAWDAIAKTGLDPNVTVSPSPRTDPSIRLLPMATGEIRKLAVRVYANAALSQFNLQNPYLASILSPPGEIPGEILDQDLVSWFNDNPGQIYPLSRAVKVVVRWLEDMAKQQAEPVATYTCRLSLALFFITQILVFTAISWFAHRSNRPAI